MKLKQLEQVILDAAVARLSLLRAAMLIALQGESEPRGADLHILREFVRDSIDVHRLSQSIATSACDVLNIHMQLGDEITLEISKI